MACTTASGFCTHDRYPVAGEDSLVGRRPVPCVDNSETSKINTYVLKSKSQHARFHIV